MSAHFDIVRTDAGWHARYRASNGRIIWSTEVYTRRTGAEYAVELIAATFGGWVHGDAVYTSVHDDGQLGPVRVRRAGVRYVDERSTQP